MSSSDEDWGIHSKPPGAGRGGDNDILSLRSRALQQQREAREARLKHDTSRSSPQRGHSSSPAPIGPAESTLPSELLGVLGSDDSDHQPLRNGTHQSKTSTVRTAPTQQTKFSLETTSSDDVRRAAPTPAALLEESLGALRQKVAAKKKALESLREKEVALLERYRREKAHKRSEISQVEAQLRTMWGKLEDEKRSAETKIREASDEYEKELLSSRRKVESEVKKEFEPQLQQLQEKLDALRVEEQKLKDLLQLEDGTRDLIHSAVASATNAIIERIHGIFTANAEDTAEWNKEVERLVEHEVRSSFAVSAGSEAQSEREEMKKHFADMLALWRKVEDEERDRILKMDDTLLADIQKLAQEDLTRLQSEEITMEEMYIQSREAWAEQHQKLLDMEQEAALKRREMEFNEQRTLRDQLHMERMKFIEENHKNQMKSEEARHQKELEMLREHFQREEQLKEEQQRTILATQHEISSSTKSFEAVVHSVEDIVASLKDYQNEVDKKRTALDDEMLKILQKREASLHSVKELVTSQRTTIESQHQQLSSTIAQISSLGSMVTEHLHEEETWLTQQEAKYTASRELWSREYRRWKQLVEQERLATEEQFSSALSGLQDCLGVLAAEEQQVKVEMNSMKCAFADIAVETEKEVASLNTRAEELEQRHEKVKEVLQLLERKGSEITAQYRELQEQRQQLATERLRVRQETARIRDMGVALKLIKSRAPHYPAPTTASASHDISPTVLHRERSTTKRLDRSKKENTKGSDGKGSRSMNRDREGALPRSSHRLPNKVLTELQQQLAETCGAAPIPLGRVAPTPKRTQSISQPDAGQRRTHADPEDLSGNGPSHQDHIPPIGQDKKSPTQLSSDQNSSSTYTFTNLVTISDNSHNSG